MLCPAGCPCATHNTLHADLAKLLAARAHSGSCKQAAHSAGVKSHVKVPRLNGGKMGVLATRSPHRPVPIGLSTAQVSERVNKAVAPRA